MTNELRAVDIHIVDDDADVRDGLAWLFDSRGYQSRTWDSGAALLEAARQRQGDWGLAVVLLDVRMQPLSGPVTFEQLKALGCPWPVLFLTGHGDVGTAVGAVKNGAWDFLEKPFQDNMLVDRVEQAMQASGAQLAAQRAQAALAARLTELTERERDVMQLVAQGLPNKLIADQLGISVRTVEVHRARVFDKMQVKSAVELANVLRQEGGDQPRGRSPT